MRDALIVIAVLIGVALFSYKTGYDDASARYELQAALVAEAITNAVSSASEALSGLVQTIATDDSLDADKLREIEDAARNDGAVCHVPADRLRSLDSIAN